MFCTLCNDPIEQIEMDLGSATVIGSDYWHVDCHAEYFDETLELV